MPVPDYLPRRGKDVMSIEAHIPDRLCRLSLLARWTTLGALLLTGTLHGDAATVSPLFARGYTVIPTPQKVTLGTNDFEFTRAWHLESGPGIQSGDVAVESLR